MSAKIINDPNHSFSIELATRYGVLEALMINHILFWMNFNKRLKKNFHEGMTWMYETIEEMCAHFPYMSYDQLQRLLAKLVEKGIVIKGNFNKWKNDRTSWYTIKEEMITPVPSGMTRNRVTDDAESRQPLRESASALPDTEDIYKRKQQQPTKLAEKGAVAPVAVFSCLKELGIPQNDKLRICSTYDETTVKHAVAYCLHPDTKIKTSLVQVLQWACKEKPEVPKDKATLEAENKLYARNVVDKLPANPFKAVAISSGNGIEIYFQGPSVRLPVFVTYSEGQFKQNLREALIAFGWKQELLAA